MMLMYMFLYATFKIIFQAIVLSCITKLLPKIKFPTVSKFN